jgi:P4 family phage/plasmid primase-like protien
VSIDERFHTAEAEQRQKAAPKKTAGTKKRSASASAAVVADEALGDFPRNDDDLARMIVERYGASMRWVPGIGEWVVWRDGAWTEDEDGVKVRALALRIGRSLAKAALAEKDAAVRSAKRRLADRALNVASLNAALHAAKSLPNVTVPASAFDSDPRVIASAASRLELGASTTSRPIERGDFLRMNTGTRWEPGAIHESWTDFLRTFQPDKETRRWLQALAGYSLLGGNPERLFVICIGGSTSGKSFFAVSLAKALGSYGGSFGLQLLRAKQDSDINVALADSMEKRFIYAEEPSDGWILHADEMKRLTGETLVTVRRPFEKRSRTGEMQFTPWMVANAVPTVRGADTALRRRLVLVPFTQTLTRDEEKVERRRALHDPDYRTAVLAWAVAGAERYLREGWKALETPVKTLAFAAEQLADLNQNEQFLADRCVRKEGYREVPSDLYKEYEMWCEENNIPDRERESLTKFGTYLTRNGFHKRWARTDDGSKREFRFGLALRSRI